MVDRWPPDDQSFGPRPRANEEIVVSLPEFLINSFCLNPSSEPFGSLPVSILFVLRGRLWVPVESWFTPSMINLVANLVPNFRI